jgi:hypothetical protein
MCGEGEMTEIAAIIEMDTERDRKTCVALDLKVSGANRELAQWLMDHPRYSSRVVAEWLGCHHTKILLWRKWANGGFVGAPFGYENHPDKRQLGAVLHQETLKSKENFEDDTFEPDGNVEEPRKVIGNVLDTIRQSKAVAEAYRKILKVSPFDSAAKKQISDEIEWLIRKWRSVQSTLATKGKADVEQSN